MDVKRYSKTIEFFFENTKLTMLPYVITKNFHQQDVKLSDFEDKLEKLLEHLVMRSTNTQYLASLVLELMQEIITGLRVQCLTN